MWDIVAITLAGGIVIFSLGLSAARNVARSRNEARLKTSASSQSVSGGQVPIAPNAPNTSQGNQKAMKLAEEGVASQSTGSSEGALRTLASGANPGRA